MLIITPTQKEKEPLTRLLHSDAMRICGIGRVNTASFLTEEIIIRRPNRVLLVGCAGAYAGSGLSIGDVAVAQSEFSADEGVVDETGFQSMEEIGMPVVKKQDVEYFNLFPVDETFADMLLECARLEGLTAEKGRFITVSGTSGTKQRADTINKSIGALCENMEGAAAAHICLKYDIPFAEIRGISNVAGQRKPFDLMGAMSAVGRVLRKFRELGIGELHTPSALRPPLLRGE
ncbi:MAG: futalosine hydrolase [Pseudomonadota bacterium]